MCEEPDLNECKYRPCSLFAHCTNTLGSFYCTCRPGYSGDGLDCSPDQQADQVEDGLHGLEATHSYEGRSSICLYNGVEYQELEEVWTGRRCSECHCRNGEITCQPSQDCRDTASTPRYPVDDVQDVRVDNVIQTVKDLIGGLNRSQTDIPTTSPGTTECDGECEFTSDNAIVFTPPQLREPPSESEEQLLRVPVTDSPGTVKINLNKPSPPVNESDFEPIIPTEEIIITDDSTGVTVTTNDGVMVTNPNVAIEIKFPGKKETEDTESVSVKFSFGDEDEQENEIDDNLIDNSSLYDAVTSSVITTTQLIPATFDSLPVFEKDIFTTTETVYDGILTPVENVGNQFSEVSGTSERSGPEIIKFTTQQPGSVTVNTAGPAIKGNEIIISDDPVDDLEEQNTIEDDFSQPMPRFDEIDVRTTQSEYLTTTATPSITIESTSEKAKDDFLSDSILNAQTTVVTEAAGISTEKNNNLRENDLKNDLNEATATTEKKNNQREDDLNKVMTEATKISTEENNNQRENDQNKVATEATKISIGKNNDQSKDDLDKVTTINIDVVTDDLESEDELSGSDIDSVVIQTTTATSSKSVDAITKPTLATESDSSIKLETGISTTQLKDVSLETTPQGIMSSSDSFDTRTQADSDGVMTPATSGPVPTNTDSTLNNILITNLTSESLGNNEPTTIKLPILNLATEPTTAAALPSAITVMGEESVTRGQGYNTPPPTGERSEERTESEGLTQKEGMTEQTSSPNRGKVVTTSVSYSPSSFRTPTQMTTRKDLTQRESLSSTTSSISFTTSSISTTSTSTTKTSSSNPTSVRGVSGGSSYPDASVDVSIAGAITTMRGRGDPSDQLDVSSLSPVVAPVPPQPRLDDGLVEGN